MPVSDHSDSGDPLAPFPAATPALPPSPAAAVRNEVILPRRAAPQPVPHLNSKGDCGPCCLASVIGETPQQIYASYFNSVPQGLTYYDLSVVLQAALREKKLDRLVLEHPQWSVSLNQQVFGSPAWLVSKEWFAWVRMALDAGYYAFALVSMDQRGPVVLPDHYMLICGAREVEVSATLWVEEILVSCPAGFPEGRWFEARPFLMRYGGFNCFLARPKA